MRPAAVMRPVAGLVTGRVTGRIVVAIAILLSGLALALGGTPEVGDDPTGSPPPDAESSRAADLIDQLPASDVQTALVVFARDGEALTGEDRAAIATARGAFAATALGGRVAPPVVSQDGSTALVAVPLPGDLSEEDTPVAVESLREAAAADLPTDLQVAVTGGPAFSADLSQVFDGADVTLLAATASVVALLLLVTYRSPWLWLVPLSVVVVADQVAAKIVAILTRITQLTVDGATVGITSVLVFGAGTNYALLLIARYREELRSVEDRYAAMRAALSSAAPAILASAATVVLALLTLAFAVSPFNRSIGFAGAAGIVVAAAYALLVLPAALLLFSRRLFWPFVPRTGEPDPTRTGPWSRIGRFVVRRPVAVLLASALALGTLAAGTSSISTGLSETEQFRDRVESIEGQELLARSFPAGASQPTVVVGAVDRSDDLVRAASEVPGTATAEISDRSDELARVDVTLTSGPGSDESLATIEALRVAVGGVDGAEALVGGPEALALDTRDAAARDREVVIPLVLVVVLVVLLLLLRSVVAAVLLVLTVVATYVASLGASWLVLSWLTDFPAFDLQVPLLGFLFLVALGVDYNIFLTTRAREETDELGAREGIVVALAVTGGVITSAGILLAAVFTVLGVLPLVTLTQLGVVVGLGVLLDALLVRSVVVPALVSLTGRFFWWPSRLSRPR